MTTTDEKLLYRVEEVAQLLGISRSKTWELLGRGDLGSVKIDGSRRITREAIEAYVARLTGGGGDAAAT